MTFVGLVAAGDTGSVGRMALHTTSSLEGRVALVTGSSRGIGRAIAVALAEAGAHVGVHYATNFAGAKETAATVRAFGVSAEVFQADLSLDEEQDRLVAEVWRKWPIDIWINNAGVDVLTGAAASWTFAEKIQRLWQVDVMATVRVSRAVGRRMQERGRGVILNMGWDQASTGMEGDSGEMFATTKGAVMAFTRSLSRSLAPEVRVNCLAPGWIRTAWGEGASGYWDERARQEALLKRWGTPEDVARVARFLASDEAAFITGQIVNINGGMRSG